MKPRILTLAACMICSIAAGQPINPGHPITGNQFDLVFNDPDS